MLKVTSNALRQQVVNREGKFIANICIIIYKRSKKIDFFTL